MRRLRRVVLATVGLFAALWGVGGLLHAAFEPGNPVRGLGYVAGGLLLLSLSLRLYRKTHQSG